MYYKNITEEWIMVKGGTNFKIKWFTKQEKKSVQCMWNSIHSFLETSVTRLPVSKRGDDQPLGAAQELILVNKVYICDGDNALVGVFHKIEAGLFNPFEVCWWADVILAL